MQGLQLRKKHGVTGEKIMTISYLHPLQHIEELCRLKQTEEDDKTLTKTYLTWNTWSQCAGINVHLIQVVGHSK